MATIDVFMLEQELDGALSAVLGADIRLRIGVAVDSDGYQREPPWRGSGYIAGEAPDGLVTFNGSPAVRALDLFDRETNICCTSTQSAADGTYMFVGLNTARLFDVRARGGSGENDLIVAGVTPHS